MNTIFRKIQRYPWKIEFRYATGRTFSRAHSYVCVRRTCQHLRISVIPVRTPPDESWGSENITMSANARASGVGGRRWEARRGRVCVGEGTELKTGGWSPLADGWGCVCDYIRRPCPPAFHPRRSPLNNASHSSIRLLGLRSSTYDHSGSLFLASDHLIRPSPVSTAPRVLITTVALIWVGGSDDGEEEGTAATTCLSKRSADMCYFEGV